MGDFSYKSIKKALNMRILAISSLAALVLATTGAANAAELIVDGGFEQPIVTTPGLFQSGYVPYNPGDTFGGPGDNSWKVVGAGNNIAVTSTTEFTNGPTFYNGHSGLQWIDLTGAFDNGASVGIEQSISTLVGTQYNLSFWLGTFVDAATSVQVLINGVSIGTFTNPTGGVSPGNGNNWQQFTQNVVATNTTTTVGFYYAGGRSVAGLDDVSFSSPSVSAAPEPATWIMLIFGFGMTGVAMRRRKKTSNAAFA